MIPVRTPLTVSQICSSYPGRGGRRLHPATVGRWIADGVKVPSGHRLRLRATRLGTRWLVDPEDWDRFLADLTAAQLPAAEGEATPSRTPGERHRAAAEAGAELRKLGC